MVSVWAVRAVLRAGWEQWSDPGVFGLGEASVTVVTVGLVSSVFLVVLGL